MSDTEQNGESFSNFAAWAKQFEQRLEKLMLPASAKLGPGYFSLKAAALYSDLSQKTLRRFIKSGRLQEYRPARGKILIKRKELDALIEKSTTKVRRGRGIR